MRVLFSAIFTVAVAVACWPASAQPAAPATQLDARKMLIEGVPDEALEQSVQQIERDPGQAGAWLDFAVTLCQKGRGADAQAVLSHVETSYAPPEGIREVINLLRASNCEGPGRQGRVSVTIQRGYDDNVNQGSSNTLFELGSAFPGVVLPLSPEFLPMGDHYSLLDASVAWGQREGIQFNLQTRTKQYDQRDAFNTSVIAFSADKDWSCGTGRCGTGATLGRIDLGGKPYQYLASWQVGRVGAAGRWGSTVAFEAGLTRQMFPTQPTLDALVGLSKVTGRLPAPGGGLLQLSASAGVDLPTADRPGGRRTLAAVGASGTHPFAPGLQADWALTGQLAYDSAVYSPGLIDTVRRPVLRVVDLGLSKSVTQNQRLRLEYRRADNHDTVSLFSYRGSSVTLSWQWRGDF